MSKAIVIIIKQVEETKKLEELFLQIRTDKFYFLKFILEGYDGLAILSSSGIRKSLVRIRFPKERRAELFGLLSSIAVQLNSFK